MNSMVNAAARLDRLPMGGFHWRILRLVGFGMFFDSFDNSMAAGVMAALVKQGWSTLAMNANFISATFIGLSIGAALAGLVGDRYGRRFAYQFNLLIFGATCILSALAPSMTWLIVLRGIMGIGIGAEYVVGYATVCEFVPPQRRGWALALVGVMTMSGGFVVSLIGLAVIPTLGWRPMFLIGGAGALWVWYMRRKLPESPRWLEAMGRTQEAESVMRAIEQEAAPGVVLPPIAAVPAAAPRWVPFRVLFSRAVLSRTLLAMAVNIVCLVGFYSFSSWVPTFFVSQGLSVSRSLSFTTVMTIGAIVGPLTGLLVSDRIGRRRGLMIAALCCGVVGLVYSQQHTALGIVACGFLLVTGMTLMISFGVGAYTAELFPTEYRFRGGGLAQMTGRVAVILSPYAVLSVFHAYGVSVVVAVIALLYLALALGIALFGIETNQVSLEAITPPAEMVHDPANEAIIP
jgi:MFS transporter, putative metabolite:H+ symporter